MQSSPARILVVDDEPDVLSLAKESLERSGELKVDRVCTATEARIALQKDRYHVIVCVYRMPGEDGIQFLRSLRSTGDRTPFILLNEKASEDVAIEALNSGADAYVRKGGDVRTLYAELERRIATVVNKSRSQTALMDSESEYRSLFENNPDLVALVDTEGMILNCNQATAEMVSLPIEKIIGHAISSLGVFNQEDLVRFQKGLGARSRGELCPPIIAQVHREDGTKGWVEVRASIIRKAGHRQIFQIIGRDITEQKHAEEELTQTNAELRRTNEQVEAAEEELRKQCNSVIESEDELRKEMAFSQSVVDSLPGIFYLYDAQTLRLVKWNKNHQEVSGYTQEEMLGKHVLDWHRPDNAGAVLASIQSCMIKGQTSMEGSLVMKDGREVPYLLTGRRLVTKDGTFFMGVGIDITERQELDRKMQELNRELAVKEQRFSRLMEQTFDAVFTHRDGRILQANEAARRLVGARSMEDCVGHSVYDFVGAGSEGLVKERLQFLYDHPGTVAPLIEEKFRRVDGTKFDVEVMATSYLDDMKPTAQVVFRDVSVRKRLETELRESEEFYRQLMSNLSLGVVIIDPKTRTIESVNEAAVSMFGETEENIIGHHCYQYLCPGTQGACPFRESGKEIIRLERTLECSDGRRSPILKTVKRINIRGQERMLECFMDITEREQAQSALRDINRKLNLLSEITRHDIDNQLMLLTGHVALMKRERPDAASDEHLQKLETAAKRISAMIQFTKTYQEIGVQAPTWQNVRALIDKSARTVNLGPIRIINEIPFTSQIFADPLIGKVVLNLMHNATIYGGGITFIHFSIEEKGGAKVIVCEDDGVGISEEMKKKLFTKGSGNGHGLGLFLSREILAITGINITEESEPGKGARFVITPPKNCFRAA